MTARRVLIVEDDESIAAGLSLNLKIEGYAPVLVTDGEAAVTALTAGGLALVILDISLPRKNGLEVLSEARARGDQTPIIILSARHDEFDKVAALKLGADDYVTKPFAVAELLARVEAVLRRAASRAAVAVVPERAPTPPPRRTLDFGDVVIDLDMRTVKRDGTEVALTHLEFELLAFFASRPAQAFSREELLREVWDVKHGTTRTVDNFIAQLRAKLEADPEHPRHVVTVRGTGYRFDP